MHHCLLINEELLSSHIFSKFFYNFFEFPSSFSFSKRESASVDHRLALREEEEINRERDLFGLGSSCDRKNRLQKKMIFLKNI